MPMKAPPAEQGVDDYGLHWDGTRRVALRGGWVAVLQAGATTAGITYRGPDGIPRTAVPTEVNSASADKLATLRAQVKAVRAAIGRERAWIDGLLAAHESWDLAAWRRRYLD